ncbi:hypothetical protein CBR_g45412 [Chara braunii]|uniref:phosphoribosylglycinamide formyltransferase 1 n=1 Tax=Chara braunii TaxID=69332 RepID=A0A388LYP1_CHABU|nr:hypothetical protein CBR_g45412 [Chara braunii]|eukprot:GBG87352.1 hypothetical protein CBR_g45412 [Chara braunii]
MAATAQYSYVGLALSDRSRSIEPVCRGEDGSVFTSPCRGEDGSVFTSPCRGEDGTVFTSPCRVVQSAGAATSLDRPGRRRAATRGASFSLHCAVPLSTRASTSKKKKASDCSFSSARLSIHSRIWPQRHNRKPEGLLEVGSRLSIENGIWAQRKPEGLVEVGSLHGGGGSQNIPLTIKLKADQSWKECCFHGAEVLPSWLVCDSSLNVLPAVGRCTGDLSSASSLCRLGHVSASASWSRGSQARHAMGHHNVLFPRGCKMKMPISSRRISAAANPLQGQGPVNVDVAGDPGVVPAFDVQDGEETSVSAAELPSQPLISADDAKERPKDVDRRKLAVFVSGGGSNLRALHASILGDKIKGEVAVVVSDKPKCGGCEYAREHGIPVIAFPRSKAAPEGVSADQLVTMVLNLGVKAVLLAGYLKLVPAELVRAFPRAVLNIHPALLPAFGGQGYFGMHVHEAVVRSGVRVSGATVHFVDEEFDTGPIVAQRVVPVYPLDSAQEVAQRVLKVEHELYSWVAAALCEDRIVWREDGRPMSSDCSSMSRAERSRAGHGRAEIVPSAEQSTTQRSRAEQSGAERSRAEQSRAEHNTAEHSKAGEQSRAEWSGAEQSRDCPMSRAEQDRTQHSGAEQSRRLFHERSRAEQSRAEQSRAEQSTAEQIRAEHNTAEQSRAEQSRAEQSRAEQSGAEQSRVCRISRAEQSRTQHNGAEQRLLDEHGGNVVVFFVYQTLLFSNQVPLLCSIERVI